MYVAIEIKCPKLIMYYYTDVTSSLLPHVLLCMLLLICLLLNPVHFVFNTTELSHHFIIDENT
jgi:hypothetical protein